MPLQRNKQAAWDERIERARELAKRYSFAGQILSFYSDIAAFQQSLQARLKSAGNGVPQSEGLAFRESLDVSRLLPGVPELVSLVARAAPSPLAQAANELEQAEPEYWEYLLSACWKSEGNAVGEAPETHLFFARALLQPYAAHLAGLRDLELPRYGPPTCPLCSAKPLVGVLREEGHGAKRSLVCSLCLTEWDFLRVICPACGEESFDKLASYTASHLEHVRVE
ncbi:MAG TPA: formate dehydrogenase accessory protein FdhE, partial [Candidatus Acidoferrales bacterium]|nr:formate dehydrogenase accessory protein FdhE [Candidatus Acidoferrales bacterium]